MVAQLFRIRDVDSQTVTWRAKVIVCEKMNPRRSVSSPTVYQRITLKDEEGQRVVASLYASNVQLFRGSFNLESTYTILNARVLPVDPRYNIFDYPFHWIIHRRTAVRWEQINVLPPSLLHYRFTPFHALKSLVHQNALIDVLGVVIDKRGCRSVLVDGRECIFKEYALMNEEKEVVIMTLWNNIADSEGAVIDNARESLPVIRASGLTVSKYYDGSLGSTPSTVIVKNPRIPEARELIAWRDANLSAITPGISIVSHLACPEVSSTPQNDGIMSLADVLTSTERENFIVKVKVVVMETIEKLYYMGCDWCCAGVNTELDYLYTCSTCKRFTRAKPRQKIYLCIYDSTGCLDVVAYGTQGMKVTGISSMECMDMLNKGIPFPVHEINQNLHAKTFVIRIKKRPRHTPAGIQNQFILKGIDLQELSGVTMGIHLFTGLRRGCFLICFEAAYLHFGLV